VLVDNKVPSAVDNVQSLGIQLFPNPVSDYCNIRLGNGTYELTLYNMIGKEIYRANVSQSQYKLDMRKFERGIYLLRIKNIQNNSSQNFKVNKL
jgi:hypothetical protein